MLGINAKASDRVQVQLRLTCSPVNVTDLATSERTGDSLMVRYFLGPVGSSPETRRYNSAVGHNTGLAYSIS